MKTRTPSLSKSELSLIRRRLGLTIKDMARSVGLKLPSYYYYETRYAVDVLPDWLTQRVFALARKRKMVLSPRVLRTMRGKTDAAFPSPEQTKLLRDILKTLNEIKAIMRDRGPSAVFVVQDGKAGPPNSRAQPNATGGIH